MRKSYLTDKENLASIIIVTYNHRKYLEKCIKSIRQQDFPFEIILVDNNSSDGTKDYVRKNFPDVKLIARDSNLGFSRANNIGAKRANGEFLVFLNPDTYVNDNWLNTLLDPILLNENIITTPKILLYDGSFINTCGNINHFSGLTFTRGYGENIVTFSKPEFISGVSGACFALKKKDFIKLGGFDEDFFLYNEDSEFSWRALSLSFKILYVPGSIIFHKYELIVTPKKLYNLEKGRYIILNNYMTKKDRILLIPSMLFTEILVLGYSVKLGWKGIFYKMNASLFGIIWMITKPKYNDINIVNLYSYLYNKIPVDQLTNNIYDKYIKMFINIVYEWNFRILKVIYRLE